MGTPARPAASDRFGVARHPDARSTSSSVGVPIVFAGSRKHAEEWTYRYLGAARPELG